MNTTREILFNLTDGQIDELESNAKQGNADALFNMGLLYLLGLTGNSNFNKASVYFDNKIIRNDVKTNLLRGYVAECNNQLDDAILCYSKCKQPSFKFLLPQVDNLNVQLHRITDDDINGIVKKLDDIFKKTKINRTKLSHFFEELGFPTCPQNSELSKFLNNYSQEKCTISETCMCMALLINVDHWFEIAAWCLCAEQKWHCAKNWLRRSHADMETHSLARLIEEKITFPMPPLNSDCVIEFDGISLFGDTTFDKPWTISQTNNGDIIKKWQDTIVKARNVFINKKRAAEEARRKAEEEARRKAEEEARRKAEEEARRKAEEEARRKAEEEARRKAEEEARRKAEEEARRKAEEEARRAAEEARRKAEEKARRKTEKEARRKEEEIRRRAEYARNKFAEEVRERLEHDKRKEEEVKELARRKAEEEARRKEEEIRRRAEYARNKFAEEVRERLEHDKRKEEEAKELARRKAEEEARRKAAEESARREKRKGNQGIFAFIVVALIGAGIWYYVSNSKVNDNNRVKTTLQSKGRGRQDSPQRSSINYVNYIRDFVAYQNNIASQNPQQTPYAFFFNYDTNRKVLILIVENYIYNNTYNYWKQQGKRYYIDCFKSYDPKLCEALKNLGWGIEVYFHDYYQNNGNILLYKIGPNEY